MGVPTPTITWYHNNVIITGPRYFVESVKYPDSNYEYLNINNLISADSGEYHCSAMNIAGTSPNSSIITVRNPETKRSAEDVDGRASLCAAESADAGTNKHYYIS